MNFRCIFYSCIALLVVFILKSGYAVEAPRKALNNKFNESGLFDSINLSPYYKMINNPHQPENTTAIKNLNREFSNVEKQTFTDEISSDEYFELSLTTIEHNKEKEMSKTSKIELCNKRLMHKPIHNGINVRIDKDAKKAYVSWSENNDKNNPQKKPIEVDYFEAIYQSIRNEKNASKKYKLIIDFLKDIEIRENLLASKPIFDYKKEKYDDFIYQTNEIQRKLSFLSEIVENNSSSKVLITLIDNLVDEMRLYIKTYFENYPNQYCKTFDIKFAENYALENINTVLRFLVFDFTDSKADDLIRAKINLALNLAQDDLNEFRKFDKKFNGSNSSILKKYISDILIKDFNSGEVFNNDNLKNSILLDKNNTEYFKGAIFKQKPLDTKLFKYENSIYCVIMVSFDEKNQFKFEHEILS